jgi:hypothetical protein
MRWEGKRPLKHCITIRTNYASYPLGHKSPPKYLIYRKKLIRLSVASSRISRKSERNPVPSLRLCEDRTKRRRRRWCEHQAVDQPATTRRSEGSSSVPVLHPLPKSRCSRRGPGMMWLAPISPRRGLLLFVLFAALCSIPGKIWILHV